MLSVKQGLKKDGIAVPMTKLCQRFGMARRTLHYRATRKRPVVRPELAEPIKQLIEEEPTFGYRTAASLLGMNKNIVQRIFQLKGWQVRKRQLVNVPHPVAAVTGHRTEIALGNGSVPRMGRQVWLAQPGPADRLSYPATAGSPPPPHQQGQHGLVGIGTCTDHPL